MQTRFSFRARVLIMLITLSAACTPQSTPIPALTYPSGPVITKAPGTPLIESSPPPGQLTSTEPTPASKQLKLASELSLILGSPTANTISASLLSTDDRQINLAYGTESGNYPHQIGPISLQAGRPQRIEITSLAPNTTYYYLVISGGSLLGEHSFHTQRPPGSAFTFTIDADPHNLDPRFNGELYTTTLTNAWGARPDFHINLGDTFMTEKVKAQTYGEVEKTFADMLPFYGRIGADVPLFLVNGNHEGELGWLLSAGEELPIWSTQLRQQYYPNPVPNDFYTSSLTLDPYLGSIRDSYYAWTWGDALFIVLDPFWYTASKPKPDDLNSNWYWTLGREQYDWLKATLENSDAKFKFVFIHHLVGGGKDARGGIEAAPFFEWGGKNADGTYGFDEQRPGWGMPIHQLLVQNHVSAVFHGHDHVFVKQDLDGIVYQEVPQPSNAEYNKTRLASDYGYGSGDFLSSSGHLLVTVSPDLVTVKYIRGYLPQDEKTGQQNGQLEYQYRLK